MPSAPVVTAAQAIRVFEQVGFYHARTRGSHYMMKKDGCASLLSIPMHKGKTVGTGLLLKQIKAAGLTVEQFIALL